MAQHCKKRDEGCDEDEGCICCCNRCMQAEETEEEEEEEEGEFV